MTTRMMKYCFYLGHSSFDVPRVFRKYFCKTKFHRAWFAGHQSKFGIGVDERMETKKLLSFERYSNHKGIIDKKNGRYAYMNGEPESSNPYPVGELGYAFWLEGYIHASTVISKIEMQQ